MGDPSWLPHPVVAIGRLIASLEKPLRRIFPKTAAGERVAGGFMVLLTLGCTALVTGGGLWLAGLLHPLAGFVLELFWCCQILAARCLVKESTGVYRALKNGTLAEARTAVGRIVGRDTGELSAEGVTKAAVETVAENTGDGVIAPLLFITLGGALGGMLYKAVNTMDSMVGYRNKRYRDYGTAAARLDDLVNWLPARLTALFMVVVSAPLGLDAKSAYRVWRRDRRNHKSPNSAHPESACAGALGVQLAGDACYFGELVRKPTIGDPMRPVTPEDIPRANRLLYGASALCLALCCVVRLVLAALFAVL